MKYWFYTFFVYSSFVLAQSKIDSVVRLNEFEVRAIEIEKYSIGHQLDSLSEYSKFRFKQNFLGQSLQRETPISIREYGAGNIASVSYRGLSPSHTGLFWEGIPLNSLFLAQFDYNNLSSNQFEDISFRRGGSSSLVGSGAVGGSIHLENSLKFNPKLSAEVGQNIGSFGFSSTDLNLNFSNKKVSARLFGQYTYLQNDYAFTDLNGERQTRENSSLNRWSGLAQVGIKPAKNQLLKISIWSNNNGHRDYAGAIGTSQNSRLENPLLLASALYSIKSKKSKHTAQLAYSQEDFIFTQNRSSSDSPSESRAKARILRYEWQRNWLKNLEGRLGILGMISSGEGDNYAEPEREEANFFLSMNYTQAKWQLGLNLNKGISSDSNIPFTVDVGANFNATKHHGLFGNFTTNFRSPSLNDNHYVPGGNPDLKPEEGWMAELGYTYTAQKKWIPSLRAAAYYGKFDNFIEWIPNQVGIFSPINQNKVENHGLEFLANNQWRFGGFTFQGRAQYAYTISRLNDLNTQRRYVPKHKATASLTSTYKNWQLIYNGQFMSDIPYRNNDSRFLDSFTVHDLHLGRELNFSTYQITLLASVKNLFDTEYQTFNNHPLPGRNYNLQLRINFNQVK